MNNRIFPRLVPFLLRRQRISHQEERNQPKIEKVPTGVRSSYQTNKQWTCRQRVGMSRVLLNQPIFLFRCSSNASYIAIKFRQLNEATELFDKRFSGTISSTGKAIPVTPLANKVPMLPARDSICVQQHSKQFFFVSIHPCFDEVKIHWVEIYVSQHDLLLFSIQHNLQASTAWCFGGGKELWRLWCYWYCWCIVFATMILFHCRCDFVNHTAAHWRDEA